MAPAALLLALVATATGVATGLQARTALAISRHPRILPAQLAELAYRLSHEERQRESMEHRGPLRFERVRPTTDQR